MTKGTFPESPFHIDIGLLNSRLRRVAPDLCSWN